MGQSTNAILAFGFDLGAEEEDCVPEALRAACDDGDGGFDFETLVLADAGLREPNHQDYKAPEWRAYWDAKDAAVKAYPVALEFHCSGEYTMYFLAIQGTVTTARRGYPQVVELASIAPEKEQALRDFCERFGIEWVEPRWTVFSYWC
jgi:hypothetical protein